MEKEKTQEEKGGRAASSLFYFLKENNFVISRETAELLEKIITSPRKAVMLRGPAGVGKTELTFLISKFLSSKYLFFQCTFGTGEDELLYKFVPSEASKSGVRVVMGPLPRALKISQKEKVVLVLDEFDKTRPSADALLLDFLQNCRVSLYLEEEETVVRGNPENIVVFVTSNDMREFSEPLLRRTAVVALEPLPPRKISELLRKKFREETVILLTQIYADTLNASLRKPATLQELFQMGDVLESGVHAPLEKLLRTFIIKYDDDWEKFKLYIRSREPYKELKNKKEAEAAVEEFYDINEEELEELEESEEESDAGVPAASLLEKIRRFFVKKVEEKTEPVQLSGEVTEVALKIVDSDFNAYSHVVKTFLPEPTDDPRRFGKFEYAEDEIAAAVVAREPLTISEVCELLRDDIELEVYYEDIIYTSDLKDFKNVITAADRIKYYSSRKIFFERSRDSSEEKVLIEKAGEEKVKVRGYLKKTSGGGAELLYALRSCRNKFNTASNMLKLLARGTAVDIVLFDDDERKTDDIAPAEIACVLQTLKRMNADAFVSIGGSYSIHIEKKKNKVAVNIGYSAGRKLEERGIKGTFKISDPAVEKIIEILQGGLNDNR